LNEEILEIEDRGQDAHETAGKVPALHQSCKLDWQNAEIRLSKGRFSHTLARPTPEMILARDEELQSEIPIAKDGSFSLPDATAHEETDAKYYDQIVVRTEGYKGAVPLAHKAAAFQGLYRREIYLEPDSDIFGEEVTILEEVGSGEEPDFTIRHVLRQPEEAELRKFRQSNSGGRMMPHKRGRQKLVTSSNLRSAMRYYSAWLVRIGGATVGGSAFSPDKRDEFIAHVDPLIQRRVVNALVDELAGSLLD
jgi:hypothetical protein